MAGTSTGLQPGAGPLPGTEMPVERTSGTTSLVDVLDRVLDGGVRLEARDRVALLALSAAEGAVRLVVAADPRPHATADAPAARAKGA